MPFYDYKCKSCSHIEEIYQNMNDKKITQCPKCKKETFERVITNTTFSLVGKGWHKTDYEK